MIWSCQGGSEDEFNQFSLQIQFNQWVNSVQSMLEWYPHWNEYRRRQIAVWNGCHVGFSCILWPYCHLQTEDPPLAQGYVIGRLEPLLCFVCPKMPILGLIHSHVWISWTLMPFQLHISKKLSKLSTTSALRQVFWLRGSTRLSSLCSPPEGLMMFLFVIIFRFHLDYITMSTQMIHLFYVKGQWFPLIKLPFSMSTPQKNILFFHWFV